MRPRRDHGDELVEHGAFRTYLCLLCIALDRFDNDREMQQIRDDRVVSKRVCCCGFPTSKSLTFLNFSNVIRSFSFLFSARERRRAQRKNGDVPFGGLVRRRLVVCAMKVKMRESDRRKQGQLFLLFVFERSYVLNERERETDQSQKSSLFDIIFSFDMITEQNVKVRG